MFTFDIRVKPNAKREFVGGVVGDPVRLIVSVNAPAIDGKANKAVLQILATAFNVKSRDVTIVHGHTSKDKRIGISGNSKILQEQLLTLQGTLL